MTIKNEIIFIESVSSNNSRTAFAISSWWKFRCDYSAGKFTAQYCTLEYYKHITGIKNTS